MGPGDVLGGRFELLGELGAGGMATVWLAVDRVRDEKVALKVLHPHLTRDGDARDRLRREVRAASRIQHERALVPHELHEVDDVLALAMPVHHGEALGDRVATRGPMAAEGLRQIAIDLAGALGAAHRRGVVHRDVTPNNVLVDHEGATLVDFGLARVDGSGATRSALAPGTWGYAAPEVLDGRSGDPRSDLYGLGAVLYQAATGHGPYEAASPAAVLRRQLDGDHTPLAELRPDLPADLVHTIEALLRPDPDARPQAASEVADALQQHEAPLVPATAVRRDTEGLPAGMYTVIVERRAPSRALARGRGPIAADEPADTERTLLATVATRAGTPVPEALPAAMRRREFILVEGVDHDTAEAVAADAVRLGFVPRMVNDPRVIWSARASNRMSIRVAMLTLLASVVMAGAAANPALWSLLLPLGLIAVGVWRGSEVRLARAWTRPQLEGPTRTSTVQHPLLRMLARTRVQLDELDVAVAGLETRMVLPASDNLRRIAARLRAEADKLAEPLQRLALEEARPAEGSEQALSRIHRRLARLDTLAEAGEPVDPRERRDLEAALAAHREAERLKEANEDLATRLSARLLEIGSAATRATRALRRDDLPPVSVSSLLEELADESVAVGDALDETERGGWRKRLAAARQASRE